MRKVRLPNTDNWVDMEINHAEFKEEFDFPSEVMGWYNGLFISIKKPYK